MERVRRGETAPGGPPLRQDRLQSIDRRDRSGDHAEVRSIDGDKG